VNRQARNLYECFAAEDGLPLVIHLRRAIGQRASEHGSVTFSSRQKFTMFGIGCRIPLSELGPRHGLRRMH